MSSGDWLVNQGLQAQDIMPAVMQMICILHWLANQPGSEDAELLLRMAVDSMNMASLVYDAKAICCESE